MHPHVAESRNPLIQSLLYDCNYYATDNEGKPLNPKSSTTIKMFTRISSLHFSPASLFSRSLRQLYWSSAPVHHSARLKLLAAFPEPVSASAHPAVVLTKTSPLAHPTTGYVLAQLIAQSRSRVRAIARSSLLEEPKLAMPVEHIAMAMAISSTLRRTRNSIPISKTRSIRSGTVVMDILSGSRKLEISTA